MANIVKWIEEKLEEDEVIEGVVIGEGDRIDDYSTSILLDSILEKKRKIYALFVMEEDGYENQ